MKIKGFTIVEIIVILAVLGILATVSVLGFSNIQSEARNQQRSAATSTLVEAFEKYYDGHGEYPSCSALTGATASVLVTLDVEAAVIKAPQSTVSNSLVCTDITSATPNDVYAYIGDGSVDCASGASCLEYTIKYKEEVTGAIKSIKSRRGLSITTSGSTTLSVAASGQTTINASWTTIQNAVSYILQRSMSDSFPVDSTTTQDETASTSASQTGLRPGTTYYYKLQAVGSTGSSGVWTDTVSARTASIPIPVISSIVPAASRDSMTLTLTASSGANSYSVQRATNAAFTADLKSFPSSSATTLLDDTAAVGTIYYYRAKATNTVNTGDSGWSATKTGIIQWLCGDKGYIGAYPSCSMKALLLSADTYLKCAIAANQGATQVYCWGLAGSGGAIMSSTTPMLINTTAVGSRSITDVSSGGTTFCVVAGGLLYCSVNISNTAFTQVGGGLAGKTVTQVVTTGSTSGADTRYQCAIASGELYCWGWNAYGQVGNGTTTDAASPVKVGGVLAGKTVTDVSIALQSTCATAAGQLYCWGKNLLNSSSVTSPMLVGGLGGYTTTSVDLRNNHACVTTTTATVLCYGDGSGGHVYDSPTNPDPNNRYGTSSTSMRSTATIIPVNLGVMPSRSAVDVGGGSWNRCALATNNNVYCWGDGTNGDLGNGAFGVETDQPVQVSRAGILGTKTITELEGSCVIADDEIFCWGLGGYGALGNGSTANSSVPVKANMTAPGF